MATVTVDELVAKTGVRNLDQECTKEDFLDLYKFCDPWDLVGKHLKLDTAEINAIDEESKSVDMKRVRLLDKWKESRAYKATYKVLVEALLACEKAQQAQEVCKILAKKQGFQDRCGRSSVQKALEPTSDKLAKPLNYEDHHHVVTQFLRNMKNKDSISLGGALGLHHANLIRMRDLPSEMVADWLQKRDNVEKTSGCPSWSSLIVALRKIGHNGVAGDIEKAMCNKQQQSDPQQPPHDQLGPCNPNQPNGTSGQPTTSNGKDEPDTANTETPKYGEEEKLEIVTNKSARHKPPAGSPLEQKLKKFAKDVKVIVHTVNDKEKFAAINYFERPKYLGDDSIDRAIDLFEPNRIALGMFGGYKAALVQTKMGADCHVEIEEVVKQFPNARIIIAVGVAYGASRHKCKFGDVLVSQFIDGVANMQFTENGDIIIRASDIRYTRIKDPLECVFVRGTDTWIAAEMFECTKEGRKSNVIPGLICCAPALVDDKKTRERLLKNSPEAIGGEMEGSSLVLVQNKVNQQNRNIGVVVIKGVADFADGKKKEGKKWQFTAAMAAASYANHKLIATGGRLFEKEPKKLCNRVTAILLLVLPVIVVVLGYIIAKFVYW